jgi:diacylglycerol kinase (ATP)
MREVIADAVKRGAETVVVLGDDKTVGRAINAIANLNITLGVIPVGQGQHMIAHYLGIPYGVEACDVLSKRIKENIDAAHVNGNYFTFYLKTLSSAVKIVDTSRAYTITPLSPHAEVFVCNFKPKELQIEAVPASFFVPHDGRMEVVVSALSKDSFISKLFSKSAKQVGDYTILPFEKIRLEPITADGDVKLMLDGEKIIKAPVEIEVMPRKIMIIVGKERRF